MTVLGISDIQEKLPYRYPMLLLDRFKIESETRFVGYKAVTFNEEFFQGHFPNHPIMPGVLQIEAMKQVAELGLSEILNPNNDKDVYLKALKKVKFRKPSAPGDRLLIEVDVKSIENGEAQVTALIRNNAGVSCQAILTLAARDYEPTSQEFPSLGEFDKTDDVVLNVEGIMKAIPHRYPFLFLDYIKEMSDSHVVAVKNTTFNEPVFRGYTPDNAVLPGTVQAEILAQAGCAAILSKPENENKIGYFMSISEAEFFHPIHPGDQLICKMEVSGGTGKFGKGDGTIAVGEKVVAHVQMMFALVDA